MAPLPSVAPWAMALARARVWALLVSVGLTLAGAALALRLEFNFSPENLFVSGDESLQFYLERQVPAFGAGDTVCAVAIHGDLTSPRVQEGLFALHHRLVALPGVLGVTSPLDARVPLPDALAFAPLFDERGRASLEMLERAAHDPMLAGLLISRDLRAAALSARLDPRWGNEASRRKTVIAVTGVVEQMRREYPEAEWLLAGVPVSQVIIVDTLQRDQFRFVPLVVLIMGALLWLSFRDGRGVLLPFLATGAATVWTLGYLVLAGHVINVVNNAIVVLLLVIGVADAVHMVSRYFDELSLARRELGPHAAIDPLWVVGRTIEAMALPCFLTTTTTAIGFASAFVADVELIREFGLDSAVGVMLAFVATLLIVPAMLGVLPLPPERAPRANAGSLWLGEALARITRASLRWRGWVLAAFGLLLAIAGRLSLDVSANQRLISELPEHDPSIVATRFFEEHLSGIFAVDVLFVAQTPERLTDPDVVRAMDEIARFAASQPLAPRVSSYADVLAGFDRALRGNAENAAGAPDPVSAWSDEKVRQIQLLFDLASDDDKRLALDGLVSSDGMLARVRGLARDLGNEVVGPFDKAMQQKIRDYALPGVELRVSGGLIIASRALATIVHDMVSSLLAALGAILLFMTLLFRSLRISLVALLPNAVPIVAAMATMAVAGIELRVATALIFSMALGVAVDACVHLLARLREERQRPTSPVAEGADELEEALVRTSIGAGRPVLYATGLLLVGFWVMAFSEFNALRHFALLGGATLLTALVVDLLVLPALAYAARLR